MTQEPSPENSRRIPRRNRRNRFPPDSELACQGIIAVDSNIQPGIFPVVPVMQGNRPGIVSVMYHFYLNAIVPRDFPQGLEVSRKIKVIDKLQMIPLC